MEAKAYKVHLFKPTTDHGKANSKIIITMVIVWAVAVFGFQILLKVLEKPRKEKSLVAFEQVWENVAADTATLSEKQTFSKTLLAVIGKTVKKEHRIILVNALNWGIYNLAPEVTKS